MSTLDPALMTLAAGQSGMFTTRQAHRVGMDKSTLCRAVADKVVLHPTRSLYAVSSLVDTTTPEVWHRHLAQGALLVYPDAAFMGLTAVLAHGIVVWGCDLTRPALMRPIHRATGVRGYWVRPKRGAVSPSEWGPATPPATSIVQLALDHGIEAAVVSADAGLRDGAFTEEDLAAAVAAVENWPGAHRARSMAALTSPTRESVGESRCGIAMSLAGIRADPQVTIRDEHGNVVARVDWLVDGTMVVVEFDGKVKFASGDPQVLWAEKKRETDSGPWATPSSESRGPTWRSRERWQRRSAAHCPGPPDSAGDVLSSLDRVCAAK